MSYTFFLCFCRYYAWEIHLHGKDGNGIQLFPASGNFINRSDGIRSATLFLLPCYRYAPLILLSFLLFHCRYHAGVANNRFIGCLVGLLLLLYMASFASRLPTRSNPLLATSKQNEQANICLFVLIGGSEGRIFEHTFLFKATCSDRLIIELVVSFVIRSEIGFSVKL